MGDAAKEVIKLPLSKIFSKFIWPYWEKNPKFNVNHCSMSEPKPTHPELDKELTLVGLWKEAVGKVFKLISKSYGIRTVTYTQIKAVKEGTPLGEFDIEVLCAEFTARVLTSKRAHSSICKEGVIHQNQRSVLTPGSFGEECQLKEFEKVTGAILSHATTNLDWLMQSDPEEKMEIEVPIDLPHLKLTSMEASLVRNSPFLIKDLYFLTANSRQAAFESINHELLRASRNTRLADAVDPVYVAQKMKPWFPCDRNSPVPLWKPRPRKPGPRWRRRATQSP